MADFSPDKLIAWAKEHKEIAIPAAVIGGAGVIYFISKNGGLGGAGSTGGAQPGTTPQPPTAGGDSTGAGGQDFSGAIGDLGNQIAASNNQNQSAIAAIVSQFAAFQQQISDALNGITGQTNQALQGQAADTNSALAALEQQFQSQQAQGDNGLGQLLAQIPFLQQGAQPVYNNGAVPTIQGGLNNFTEHVGGINYSDIPLANQANQTAYNIGSIIGNIFRFTAQRASVTPVYQLPQSGLNNLINHVNTLYPQTPTIRPPSIPNIRSLIPPGLIGSNPSARPGRAF